MTAMRGAPLVRVPKTTAIAVDRHRFGPIRGLGLDQKEAAKRAALTRSRLDKIEGGEYIPTLDVLIRLAGTTQPPSASSSTALPGILA
jgi:DNA-binding XRE family transcriptional regulator